MLNRLPKFKQIVPVYAVIAFMSFAWAILVFTWKLPSWLYFQTIYEIFAILAYIFMQTFFDTLLYLAALLIVCLILPARVFKDKFEARGTWAVIGVLGTYITYVNTLFAVGGSVISWTFAALLIGIALATLSAYINWLAKIVLEISDRLIIFLYIFIPMSLVSILTVFIRNIN